MRRVGVLLDAIAVFGCLCTSVARSQAVDDPANNAGRPANPPANAAVRTKPDAIVSPNDPAQIARMDAILQRWEAVSRQNQTLYTTFERVDETKFGNKQFVGEALFKKPSLACLDWHEVVVANDGSKRKVFTERIVCGSDRVYQMIGPTKQVIVYPLPQDARRRQLEEGPVPFLFNMQMQQAKARYNWRLMKEVPGANGAAGTYFVEIQPLQKIDMEEFSKAWVKLNDQTLLPEALQLYAPNGTDKRTYTFKGIERNGPNNKANADDNFNGPAMAEVFKSKYGYKIIVNQPGADPAAQLGARPAPPANPPPDRSRRR